jgi:uncharacterized protein YicC (UPF0701 family)
MTQIHKEAMERIDAYLALRRFNGAPLYEADLRALRDAIDAAEARERAAVAAAAEGDIDTALDAMQAFMEKEGAPTIDWRGLPEDQADKIRDCVRAAIRAISDTDALAEYVEKVRAEEREQTLAHYRNAIAQALQDDTDIFEAVLGVEAHFAAIRQGDTE